MMPSDIRSPQGYYLGVDVGGSKVAVFVLDTDGHEIRQLVFTTRLSAAQETVNGIIDAVRQTLDDAGVALSEVLAAGFGIPGRVDPDSGTVQTAVNLKWENMPVGAQLNRALGIPCFLENDVRMAALGLQRHARYANVKYLAYLSVGTGIAAGIVLDGKLYRGQHGMAGEIGHIVILPDGPLCSCGAHGCLESLAAGPAIARRAYQAVALFPGTNLLQSDPFTAESIFYWAAQGDAAALSILDDTGRYLAQALQMMVMAYDIDLIVLGGGVARSGDLLLYAILLHIHHQRENSALAHEMLRPEMFQLAPTGYEAALWGGVVLAERGLHEMQSVRFG